MYSFENNRVVKHTGAEFPIFQAPVGGISRAPLVSAVSAAGGMGLMETMFLSPEGMQEQFDMVRARTNRPFGLHYVVDWLTDRPEQEKAMLDWGLDGKANFITTGYGTPLRYIERIKGSGAITYHMTDTLDEALRAQDAGVDGVVLGGAEKGGTSADQNLHLFTLLQKARRELDIPIVATGGIADGIGMAAAFALGAEGVMMGTRFFAAAECPVHTRFRHAIVESDEVLNLDFGRPGHRMRVVKNDYSERVQRGEIEVNGNPYAGDPMKVFYGGELDKGMVGVGETAVLIDRVKCCAEIIDDTVNGFWEEVERMSELLTGRPLETKRVKPKKEYDVAEIEAIPPVGQQSGAKLPWQDQ